MQRVAYLTSRDLVGFPIYDILTIEPMREHGFEVETLDWRSGQDWSRFAAVLPRSSWDYHHHAAEFFDVLGQIDASGARLFNDLEVMRWNSDKKYLRDLALDGLRVVPTEYGECLDAEVLAGLHARFGEDLVLKPQVGAGATATYRLRPQDDPREAFAALAGRAWLAQPFMRAILDEGEFALVYFDGQFSHAVRKLVKPGDFRVQERWGGTICPVEGAGRLRERADAAIAALGGSQLYARIDLVRDGDDFALMEVELIEPSLYFSIDDEAPHRFARALARRLDAGAHQRHVRQSLHG